MARLPVAARVALAVAVALLAAELAVLGLWPDGPVVAPDELDAQDFFAPEQIQRAEAYRGPQGTLFLLGLALDIAVLLAVAVVVRRRPPRPDDRHPLLRVAAGAAGLSTALLVVGLPLSAIARQRGLDVGLVTRSWSGWAWDVVLSATIGAVITAALALVLVALMRRLGRRWWLPASGIVVAGAAALMLVSPVVVEPLSNTFTKVDGPLRAEILALAERAEVDVGEVYVVDASKRTTAANAYVAGLGATKRVVLYDNLVDRFPREELRFVVAHELAHQRFDDVPRGLLYALLVAPFGMWAVALAVRAIGPPGRADVRVLPALGLVLALMIPTVTAVANQLSRRVEARADTFALTLTDDPQALEDFRRRAAIRNVSEPDPSGPVHWLFGTHPTTMERIGVAAAWKRGVRP